MALILDRVTESCFHELFTIDFTDFSKMASFFSFLVLFVPYTAFCHTGAEMRILTGPALGK